MSNTSLLLFFSILPIVIILVLIYNIDRTKEPFVLLISFFILGIFSCFAVLEISRVMGLYLPFMSKSTADLTYIETILYAFVGVALVEEFCKWFIAFIIGYNNKEFDEVYDIIVYTVFIGLGFAFFENIVYIFNVGDVLTALSRGLLAVPAHACYAIAMGHNLSLAKQQQVRKNKLKEIMYILLSILIPVLLHGLYDYFLMSGFDLLLYVFIIFVVILDIYSIVEVWNASTKNKLLVSERFCPNCGLNSKDEVCPNCGSKME